MKVQFFGVRGSVASTAQSRIGGNTSCVSVSSQGHELILDAGTGIRELGERIVKGENKNVSLLFSHLHWDHVQGFPFFLPAWNPQFKLNLYGPGGNGSTALQEVLKQQMSPPQFPVPLAAMKSQMSFHDTHAGRTFEIGPFRVTPLELPHPQGCMGYLIESDGKKVAYCTDVELDLKSISNVLCDSLSGVDALIFDAQYSLNQYRGINGPSRIGWGHSTNVDAAQIAKQVDAQRLFLFHHDPSHSDQVVESMVEESREFFLSVEPAREAHVFAP
jgi:phosphoribosyl 1,2-cyclic phosphodiesterase